MSEKSDVVLRVRWRTSIILNPVHDTPDYDDSLLTTPDWTHYYPCGSSTQELGVNSRHPIVTGL